MTAPYYSRFLIRASDIRASKVLKLRLLMSVVSPENHQILLREFIVCSSLTCNSELIVQLFFQHYVDDSEDVLVESAIGAIGYCARVAPDCTQQALSALMTFIQSKHGQLVLDLATFAASHSAI
jgi:AP-3 complex subunit beta